ncbi:halocyanin domain-containing protein [Halobaculum sp. MBLA0147]|uniref:halocyanin domain-containing protein n=1 Tax=Halobaculum sp. MBLA0147 TaxID=3079934 RepID=UPI0035238254
MTDPEHTSTRRRLLAGAAGGLVLSLAGCLESTDDGPYGGYLSNANAFDGVTDRTGESEVRVTVGAGQGLAFDPAAVRISTGTTVVWEWTGRGGRHNVAAEDDSFASSYYVSEGETYERTFSEPGVVKYQCVPHSASGMIGVVEVVE